jgi:hypothetical protein
VCRRENRPYTVLVLPQTAGECWPAVFRRVALAGAGLAQRLQKAKAKKERQQFKPGAIHSHPGLVVTTAQGQFILKRDPGATFPEERTVQHTALDTRGVIQVRFGQMGGPLCYFQGRPPGGGSVPPDGGLQLYFACILPRHRFVTLSNA